MSKTWNIGLFISLLFVTGLTGCSVTSEPEAVSFDGVWRIKTPVTALKTVDGTAPPLLPEAEKVYKKHIDMASNGDRSYDSTMWCSAAGMPRLMTINSPFEIVDTSRSNKHLTFFHEWNWWARVVYFDDALNSDASNDVDSGAVMFLGGADPDGPMGLSKGHWEGDTLVIVTTNLIDSTLMDNSGLPHSDKLTLTERLSMNQKGELVNVMTVDDPESFSRVWQTSLTYTRTNEKIREDVCLDRVKNGESAIVE